MKAFFHSITTRIVVFMLIIAFLPLAIIFYSLGHQQTMEAETLHVSHLKVLFKETVGTIAAHIRYKKLMVENIADMARIVNTLRTAYGEGNVRIDPSLEAYIERIISRYNLYDFFIIDQDGKVIYTYKKEDDLGKNISDPLLKNTGLAQVYFQAVSMLDTSVSPLDYYPPSRRRANFIASPVIVEGKLLGAVAVQLNENTIYDLVKHYNGLGQSGEVVAGMLKPDGRILPAMPLKYDPDAFKNARVLNSALRATGLVQAVHGHYGAGKIVDYRGVECIAVWGYEPMMGWGVVVKTDKDEVLAGVRSDQRRLLYLLVFVALGIGLLIVLNVIAITRPIYALIASIRKFRRGETFDPAEVGCRGEICYLTEEFNTMAKEIRSYQQNLESKIEERTWELQQAKEEIEAISITDQLTGLYNRRHLDGALEQQRQMYERYHIPFSIAMFDLDFFKSVNDNFGHQAGDKVLCTIADIVKVHCRSIDIIGRWGGEEFLIIYPNIEEAEAFRAAENLCRAIALKSFDIIGRMTISGGVSGYRESVHSTLKRADDALYRAKKEGRNRICVHDETGWCCKHSE